MTTPTKNHYTDHQINTLLNLYFRNHQRPVPYPAIAVEMGVTSAEGLDDLVWKIITGYGGRDARGPRRAFWAADNRVDRTGWPWYGREDNALRMALAGDGQLRRPPCDTRYVAAVLARTVAEVEARWAHLNADPLGRKGFGL